MKQQRVLIAVVLVACLVVIALVAAAGCAKQAAPAAGFTASSTGTVYTCPMHPEVQSSQPGDCPKCHMKLVKKA